MATIHPTLTAEQLKAISASGGLPIQLEDPDTHKLYLLIEKPAEVVHSDEYLRDELSKGIAAIERGERIAWDPEQVKREGRRRRAVRS